MPLLTELGNVLGWISTKMPPLNGAGFVAGSLHDFTPPPGWFFLDKIFAGRKVKIVNRKTHTPVPRAKPVTTTPITP
jgi:hypothetical protein